MNFQITTNLISKLSYTPCYTQYGLLKKNLNYMIKNKLTQKWIEKLQNGETINITDLYEFSKVKLKRSRIRKKFHKHYDRYVSEEIKQTYWGICFSNPLVGSFKKQMDFKLDDIEQMEGTPNIELIYSDFQYKPNVDTKD